MTGRIFGRMAIPLLIVLAGMMLHPLTAMADTAGEVRAAILSYTAETKKNLKDQTGTIAKDGSLEFWSSGGLLQEVPAGLPPSEYVHFSLTPKHIRVVTLEEGKSAVAMYYAEGSFQIKGSDAVAQYLTRITEVYVKEGGKWKVRAAHYSPIIGGTGTNQTALD